MTQEQMGREDQEHKKKNRKRAFILLIFLILSSIACAVFWTCQNVMLFLIFIFGICYCIGEFFKYVILKEIKFELNDKLIIFITLISSIGFALVMPNRYPSIEGQFNRLYFPKDSLNFSKEIIEPITFSSTNPPKLIFAFDNSGEGLKESINDTELKRQYEKYCTMILTFLDNRLTKKYEKILLTEITYGKMLKTKLCFDLIQKEGYKGEFIIMKIGDENIHYIEKDFSILKKDIIQEEIERLLFDFSVEYEKWTNFEGFNNRLQNKIPNREAEKDGKLSEYVVYIYSDFYHDINGIQTSSQVNNIIGNRQQILHAVVQNCFIDGHEYKKNRGGKYILDSTPIPVYEKHFFINECENEKIPIRVVKTDKEFWFYSKDIKKDINTEYRIIFSEEDNAICLRDRIDGFSINGKKMKHNKWEQYNYDKTISLKFKGASIPDEVCFEIAHDNIHYFINYKFYEEWRDKNLPLFISIVFGLLIGIWGVWKK